MAIARGEGEINRSTDPPRGAAPTLDRVGLDDRVDPDSGIDEWSSPELNEDGDWVRFEYGDEGHQALTVFDNRFRVVRSERRDERVRREVSRGEPRTREVGGGRCVTEVDVTYQDVVFRGYVLQQHYRLLIVNRSLQWWYGLFDDPLVTLGATAAGSGGMAAAGHSAGTGAGAAFGGAGAGGGSVVAGVGAAGGVVAALAVGGALFVGVTKFMDYVSGDYEVDHTGWWPVLWYSDRGETVGEPTTVTEIVAMHPCDRPVTGSGPHGPIGAIDGSVPAGLEPLEVPAGGLPYDETDLPHDPDAEVDPALLDPGPVPMIEAPSFSGDGDGLRWDGFDSDHDWFRDLGVRAGYAFYAEYENRFRIVRDERFDVTVDESIPTGETRTRPLGDGRQVVEAEVEVHQRVQAGWRVDLAFQLWRTDSAEIAERYQRARLGLPDGAEPVKGVITGAALEAGWRRLFGTWLAKEFPGAAGEGMAAGGKLIGWAAVALAVANMDSKVPVGAGWTPAGYYLVPGDREAGEPEIRWIPLGEPMPVLPAEELFDWEDVLTDPDGDELVVPGSPTQDAVRSWRSGEADVPREWHTWALRNGWRGPLLGWEIDAPAVPGLVQPLDLQLERWYADPSSVPVIWQDWARAHGWLGPVVGWAPGVSQPMPTPNQADRYVIERELTKLGLPVAGLMLISGGSVPGAVYPDHDRRTVAYVPLDAAGWPVDRRQPYWHRWGQVPVAVLRVELVTGESRDHKRASITVVRMSDRQVVAGARSNPDGTWSDDPYLAIRRAWLRLTDESGTILENEPSITGHAPPEDAGGGGGPGRPAGLVPPPGEGEEHVLDLEGNDPSSDCPDCEPDAAAVAEAEAEFADLVGLAPGDRGEDHPDAVREAARAVRRARRRLELCRWARCGVTSGAFPDPMPEASDPPHPAAPETGPDCGALADEIGRRRALLDSPGGDHPDIGVDPRVRDITQAREDLANLEALLRRVCPPPPTPESGEAIGGMDRPDDPCPPCVPERVAFRDAEDQLALLLGSLPREDVRTAQEHERLRHAHAVLAAARARYERCRTALCGDQPWDPLGMRSDEVLAPYSTRTTNCERCRGIVRHLASLNDVLVLLAGTSTHRVPQVLEEIEEYESYLERCEKDCPTEGEPFPPVEAVRSCPACAPEAEEFALAQAAQRALLGPGRRSAEPSYLAELHAASRHFQDAWWRLWTCERVVCSPVERDDFPAHVLDDLSPESVAAHGADLDLSCEACLQAAALVIAMRRIRAEIIAEIEEARLRAEVIGVMDADVSRVAASLVQAEIEDLEESLLEREELIRFAEDLLERCHQLHCATSPIDEHAALLDDLREPVPPTGGGPPFWAWLLGAIGLVVVVVGGAVLVLGGGDGDDETASEPTPATAATAEPTPEPTEEPDATPEPTEEPDATPEPTPEPTPAPTPEGGLDLSPQQSIVARFAGPDGAAQALLIVEEQDDVTTFSIVGVDGQPLPGSQIDQVWSAIIRLVDERVLRLLNASAFPCGGVTDDYRVTCPIGAGPAPEGEFVMVGVELAGPIGEGAHSFTYGLAFDDAEDDTDYAAPPEFNADFFDGTEFWYRLEIDEDGNRQMYADGFSDQVPGVPRYSAAAVIEFDDTLVWLIPRDELPDGELSYRVTAFHNDGEPGAIPDPATSGGDISGAAIDDPLLPVPRDVVDFDADDTIPPNIDGTQPREAFDGDPDEHLTRVLLEDFFARIDGALTSGDRDGVIATVIPQLLAGPNGAQCIAELEASLLQANSVALNSVPAGPDLTNGFPLYAAPAQINYPTGTTPWTPFLAPGPGGRLYLLLGSCI